MLAAPAAFAQTPSPAMQRAILDGMNAETRTEIERRATGGNSVYEVLRTTLLNNMQIANLIQPGEPPLSRSWRSTSCRGPRWCARATGCGRWTSTRRP